MTMLRITRREDSQGIAELGLSGSLSGPWVAELALAYDGLTGPVPPRVDLSEVAFADLAGLNLLGRLRDEGVTLIRATPFVAAQLSNLAPSPLRRNSAVQPPMDANKRE